MKEVCERCGEEKECAKLDVEWTSFNLLCEECKEFVEMLYIY